MSYQQALNLVAGSHEHVPDALRNRIRAFADTSLPSQSGSVGLSFTSRSGKVAIVIEHSRVEYVQLDRELAAMCGFTDSTFLFSTLAIQPVDAMNSKNILFLYSDICSFSLCGNSKVNLLSVIPMGIQSPFTYNPVNLQYMRTINDYVQSIRLILSDGLGNDVKIDGTVCCVLHFKRM